MVQLREVPVSAHMGSGRSPKALTMEELRAEVERLRALTSSQSAHSPQLRLQEEEEEEEESVGGEGDSFSGHGAPFFGEDQVEHTQLQYTNGDSYQGEALHGTVRHGRGRHTCSTGDYFDGEWRRDLRHGQGLAVFASGLRYEGTWKEDKAEGTGTCVYPCGDKYEGEWRDDIRSGWGRYEMGSGDSYEGQWERDLIHGKGRYIYADGSVYEGEYKEAERTQGRYVSADGTQEYVGSWCGGMRHGRGTHHTSGVFKYQGEWSADCRAGRGTCVYSDGTVYEGEWADDVQQGRGSYRASNGDAYEGDWHSNQQHGQGTLRCANGDVYSGGFAQGQREGRGSLTCADGSRYEGAWHQDARSGQGTARLADGSLYQGEWAHNQRHGAGVCAFPDGRRFRGAWENGMWVQSSADPLHTRLRGPGLARAVAGSPATFTLSARDEDRQPRLSGGDTFRVWLAAGKPGEPAELEQAPRAHGSVADNGDGSYTASYTVQLAGKYTLHVSTEEGEAVGESPYPVRVLPAAPNPRKTLVQGAGRRAATAGCARSFTVAARDAFGNACAGALACALPLTVTITSATGLAVQPQLHDTGRGMYVVTYTAPAAGLYRLEVSSGKVSLGDSPFSLTVQPDEAQPLGADTPPPCKVSEGAVPDLCRKWAHIAQEAFREIDGAADGFDSDEELFETAEQKYEREHPEVPVVRNLEDMWMVTKMEQLRKNKEKQAAWDAERARRRAELAQQQTDTTAAPTES